MLPIPPERASASQVRAYLRNTLICKHELPPEEAEHLASLWPPAGGKHLRKMARRGLQQLFGKMGDYILESIQEDLEEEWRDSLVGRVVSGMFFLSSSLLLVISVIFGICGLGASNTNRISNYTHIPRFNNLFPLKGIPE